MHGSDRLLLGHAWSAGGEAGRGKQSLQVLHTTTGVRGAHAAPGLKGSLNNSSKWQLQLSYAEAVVAGVPDGSLCVM